MTPELWLASAALFLGALVQGSIGFGLALIASPVLVSIDPTWVPGPLMLAGLPMVVLMGWRERHAVSFRGLGPAIFAQVVGIGVGLLVRQQVSASALGVLVGVLVLLAVGVSVRGLHVEPSPRNLIYAAWVAGFMGATAAIPGPALALAHQHVAPARLRGTLVPFFIVGNVMTLAGLYASGAMGRSESEAALWLVPGVLLGLFASNFTAPRLNQSWTRIAVLAISAIAALNLVIQSVG
jgi:uncharacterized membrane protein YfcA